LVYEQGMRIDKWLWYSRLSGSRSEAQKLCESRRLRLNGRVIDRSGATVRRGAILSFPRGDQVVAVRVEALAERRGPFTEARTLYTPLLPAARPAAEPPRADAGWGALMPA
jgi:ribosome-associated heat shock protein Hsp15